MDNLLNAAGIANPDDMEEVVVTSEDGDELPINESAKPTVFKQKRVVINFDKGLDVGNSQNSWNEWRKKMHAEGKTVDYDKRNDIYCIGTTYDYEMYYNYMRYLNSQRNHWVNTGYLDAGMVPYIMWPSFMEQSEGMQHMKHVAILAGVDLIDMPSMSFLKQSYRQALRDFWIFREDLYKIMMFLNEQSHMQLYTCKEPTDASITMFLEPLSKIR